MLGADRKRPLAPWQVEEQAAADSKMLTLHLLLLCPYMHALPTLKHG